MDAWIRRSGLGALLAGLSACGGGGTGSSPGSGAPGSTALDVVEVSNGFDQLLPHRAFRADTNGAPTAELIALQTPADVLANISAQNPVLPPTPWPSQAVLPSGAAGNHFVAVRFTRALDVDSVLAATSAGAAQSGLAGSILVLALDPAAQTAEVVRGRGFIGGRTYAQGGAGLELQAWVQAGPEGPVAADVAGAAPGLGFPGTESPFAGALALTGDDTFVFVADADGNLATHETFPSGRQIVVRVTQAVESSDHAALARTAVASATVGPDAIAPEISSVPPPAASLAIEPGGGDTDVDPSTLLRMTFSEPVQPASLGALGPLPAPSSAVAIQFGPPTQVTSVPLTVCPPSAFDLSVWELRPAFAFPGNGPAGLPCNTFNEIRVQVHAGQLRDLAGNANNQAAETNFFTGSGPGIVNAPVAPDAVYVARAGATPSMSVIDLNGFGASTGSPAFDFTYQSFPAGNSNYPNNPNVRLQGALLYPPLQPGSCTVDGGSQGPFTLTVDSNLDARLLRTPLVGQVGEAQLGWALDTAFNNGLEAQGCQAGGGNLCAIGGRKLVQISQGTSSSLVPTFFGGGQGTLVTQAPGGANPISFAPHPNPPPLVFPPLCMTPFIGGREPTSIDSATGNNGVAVLPNLLAPGDAFGDPLAGLPPSGLLTAVQNAYWQGPSTAGVPLSNCSDYQVRQQVGHFLYVADRARREIVVLNSNRFSVLERIAISDPADLAMGPNLDLLAVSNPTADTVAFIDVNPASATFHQVLKQTVVGRSPRGIAWDPGNEDILVCNEGDNSVSVISAFSLEVRKTVTNGLAQPFDVVITQRQTVFGFQRQVYFGWILGRDGSLSLFESGPNGPNGWGFDDVVGRVPFTFVNPRKIAVDALNLNGSVWIAHEGPLGANGQPSGQQGGAVSNVAIDSASFGAQLLGQGTLPALRDLGFAVRASLGEERLTGIPVDLAFDNLVNLGSTPNLVSTFSAGFPLQLNGKSYVRAFTTPAGVNQPRFLLVAVPNSNEGSGVVDVLNLAAGFLRVDVDAHTPGVQSIAVPGVSGIMDYFRE